MLRRSARERRLTVCSTVAGGRWRRRRVPIARGRAENSHVRTTKHTIITIDLLLLPRLVLVVQPTGARVSRPALPQPAPSTDTPAASEGGDKKKLFQVFKTLFDRLIRRARRTPPLVCSAAPHPRATRIRTDWDSSTSKYIRYYLPAPRWKPLI